MRGWAAARPSPSRSQKFTARPGPAHHFFESLGPVRPGPSHDSEAHETRALYGPPDNYVGWPVDLTGRLMGRPMCCSVRKGACFSFFFRLDSLGQLISAHETHNQYALLTQSYSTNDSVGWLPVKHHLLVLPQHPVLLQYTLLQHPLSSKDNASTSSNIVAAGCHATQQQQSSSPVRHRHT